jgi:ubiquinone/menaquinone biosynthesis C-methylase UbiE
MPDAVRVSTVEGYALWADTWDATPSPIVGLEERLLGPWIARMSSRLTVDVGCGTGRWASRLGAIGIDASPEMLAVAARKPGMSGRLAVADAVALPVASGCADLALCTLTLGHVRDWAGAVRELARILKPGGTLLLTDFHPAAVARGWRRTFRSLGQVYELEHHPYTIEQMQDAGTGLILQQCAAGAIGEPERKYFVQADRAEMFEEACQTPVVLLSEWTRS